MAQDSKTKDGSPDNDIFRCL